ncbi:hypothetical protein RR48_13031 [Papilio machaon]|uniref:Uncharacterized protein n=1 Tax=Papilio machaon TaxID=76193 RepID=A0A194QS27_PAPMA|nr:hypothetical protein RR48_13031 [Papilio machaon]
MTQKKEGGEAKREMLKIALRSTGGWATLTSTNAWAARSQPARVEPKIDYFDNPPEN